MRKTMRPQVILNIFSSIDGRLTTAPNRNVSEWTALRIDENANDITHKLYDDLECDGLVSGSESLIVWGNHTVELKDPVYWPKKSKAYIVFDGRGRINWTQSNDLIVVTKENVSAEYIKQLEMKKIRYITAGSNDHIDLPAALERLHELGFRRLGLSGGGRINGAFLRQGLIDEFSIIIAPVAIGGIKTPTIFDCSDLTEVTGITELELIKSEVIDNKLIWMYYKKKGGII
jgi:2,5-diamino-6-(ribosylamino)-4(3H)-pyrimidinone 5'-phosphate reductase